MRAVSRLVDATELDGLASQIRLERLGQRLADAGPVTVVACSVSRGGSRVELVLDDDTSLGLRMCWPRRDRITELCSVRWDDRLGWVLVVCTADGARHVDVAWLAELSTTRARGRAGSRRRANRRGP